MAGPFDFTGQNIENTYQRVLQTDGTNVYDGTGSLFTLPAAGVSQITAGSGIVLSPTGGTGIVEITALATSYNTATGSYGSFYDTSSQLNPVGNVPRSMSFNATDISNGVSISGSTNPYNTYIKTENAGVYDIQFSAQVEKTDSGTDEIIIWLRKNGVDLIDTATTMTLVGNSTKVVAAWNWFATSAANDYYQIIWISADTGMRLLAETISATHPGIPSVILTVNRVDQFLSNTGSFSGSFTGQLIGTASWADSASQALTASFYQETDPIFVAKSASLATTGSNTFVGNQVVSGSFIIETASSAATLRVTQLGSGEAIRVEDSTTPDSTAFIVDSSGSVGIGTFAGNTVTAPLYPLHVIAPSGVDARMVFDGKQLGNAAANANITIAADTDDKVASLSFLDRNSTAYSGTSTYNGPVVGFLLDRSGSSNPLATGNRRNDFHIYSGFANRSIIFYTSASDGNTSVNVPGKPRLAITGSNIGINTTSPKVALHVISGSSSGASIQTSDTAVFESNANTYVSIYSPTASNAAVHFGSGGTGGDALGAYIRWNQGNNLMTLGTANDGDDINFVTGNETSSMYLKNNIGLGIGTTDPLYRLHVRNGAVTNSSTFAGSVGVFENSASNAFVSILSHTGYSSGVGFGSNVHRSSARLAWTHDSLNFSLSTNTGSAFLTFGTGQATERMRITTDGLVGIGTTTPQYLLDVSGSTRITNSLIVTGSISTYFTTASQETFSSVAYVSGDIIQGTIGGGVTIYDLIYLDIDGTWKDVNQTTTSSTKMLGIYIGGDQILIDGNISSTTDGVGSPIGPSIQNPDQGLPVYIDPGPSSQFNTTIPTSNYIRTLGYLYYNNTSNASNWILKFRPSTDWYKI